MSKKIIEFWDVNVKFVVRKNSYSAKTLKELKQNVTNGIGKNDMECIEAENIIIEIKEDDNNVKGVSE